LSQDEEYLEPTFGYRHYHSRDWFERESGALARYPIILAHESEVSGRGRFARVKFWGENLILVNDGQRVRAFLNICPHRGALLCSKERGEAREFRCAYHGAAFSLEGVSTSFADSIQRMNLVEVPTVRSGPWIFAALNPSGVLAPPQLPAELLDLPQLKLETKRGYFSHVIGVNWKHFIENTLETFHVPGTHSGLHEILGPDIRWQYFGDYAQMRAPIAERMEGPSSEATYIRHVQRLYPGAEWRYYFIFPSVHVTVFPEQVHFFTVSPLSESKSVVRGYYLYRPDSSRENDLLRYLNWRISLRLWREDYAVLKLLQNDCGVLSEKMELALHPRHEEVISYCQRKLNELVLRN
jgi:phenylpropionate dioxygenase-like ring-hydroxylating dioxygenase large terminal subunit